MPPGAALRASWCPPVGAASRVGWCCSEVGHPAQGVGPENSEHLALQPATHRECNPALCQITSDQSGLMGI